jgi:hypothetical protein
LASSIPSRSRASTMPTCSRLHSTRSASTRGSAKLTPSSS